MWQLILLAVSRAQSIYGDNPYSPHDTLLTPSGYSKKTTISDDELPNGDHVIVVTVRGSACFSDWLVNLNGAPALAPPDSMTAKHASYETPRAYHQGLLAVAQDMQGDVVGAIANKIDGLVEAKEKSVDLLFTGHSAGGAIAKLLYALSASPGSLFANILPSKSIKSPLDCIKPC